MYKGKQTTISWLSRILLLLLAAICITATLACQRSDNIVYEATGDAESVDITVVNETGGTEQYNDVPLPWRMDYGGFDDAQPYMYVYNNGETGAVRISIHVNGKVVKTGACSGPYANTAIYVDR